MIRLLSAVAALSALITLYPTPVHGGKNKLNSDDTPPSFDTLLFLVGEDCADLSGALPGKTVFGPTDEAFVL
jgi:hypothetical protein